MAGLVAVGGLGGIGLMSMASAQPAGVKINEVELNPRGRDAGGEWVEIYNPTSADVNIGDYKIKTSYRSTTITIPAGIVVGAGQLYVLAIEGEKLSNGDLLTLADGVDQTVDKIALVDRSDSSLTWQRLPDGGSAWRFLEGTKGIANDPATFQIAKSTPANNGSVTTTKPANAGQCVGSALCIEGRVTRVVDADTLWVTVGANNHKVVDLSLTKTTRNDKLFTQGLCLGSNALVDQDDKQPGKGKSIMGVVYCASTNLNQQLLDSGHVALAPRQCATSEFASQDWAKRHGC
ncbi:MAG: lamin tail domain-containing protein [Nitrososphaera sp.]